MAEVVAEFSTERPELNLGTLLVDFLRRTRILIRSGRGKAIADMLGERLLERRGRRIVIYILRKGGRRHHDTRNCHETGEMCNRPYEQMTEKLPKHYDLVLRNSSAAT